MAELAALQAEAKAALASGDENRIEMANRALQAASDRHLAGLQPNPFVEAVAVICIALLLAGAVRLTLVEPFRVSSGAMVPTVMPGDVILVNRAAWGLRLPLVGRIGGDGMPARGEVVVFDAPTGEPLVKRVIGLPGDVVELVDGQVRLGETLQPAVEVSERFEYWNFRADLGYWHPHGGRLYLEELDGRRYATVRSLLRSPWSREGPFLVPPGNVLVVGDNRDEYEQGLDGGAVYVPIEALRGRVERIAFSWGRDGYRGGGGSLPERLWIAVDGLAAETAGRPLPDAARQLAEELARAER